VDGTDQKEDSVAAIDESVNDGSSKQLSGQQTTEQEGMQQPTINGSGKGKQWLATMRVRGQRMAMAAKGGSSQRRDCHGQRGVIGVLEVAEASWIWMSKVHVAEGGRKHEDESVFWGREQLLR
jgi:hypothetical protein